MPPRSPPERIVILVFVLTAAVAACDNKARDIDRAATQPTSPAKTQKSWNVVPALGVRG
ncbi:hypothetical protein [Noviherbaspirillum saxi]|uniref:hypothetical protein n=1 Tax=Noviherbaspirillum saxi TaxID=2320863 RepID=UPI001314FCED|nr:hypothetical protein [Noviherbaspirillum saxi]